MTHVLPEQLFSEDQIAARLQDIAKVITIQAPSPEIIAPILVGGFVFASDLMRALAREGVVPHVEMLWLSSYGNRREGEEISVIRAPGPMVQGRHVLIADGVLDMGRTAKKASALLLGAGAASVRIAVAVDKCRKDAVARADFSCFTNVQDFVAGYGMDDAGRYRALPYIGRVRTV